RKNASDIYGKIKLNKHTDIIIEDISDNKENIIALIEGLSLSHYQFLKYFNDISKRENKLKTIYVHSKNISDKELITLKTTIEAVYSARDLVNEPLSYLNTTKLAEEITNLSKISGFKVEHFNKKKIESLNMNGLLAVNKGSIDDPLFSVLEWKPENAKNTKPIIIVGKGVVYDTGGLSLKPNNHMLSMKSDMAGGAVTIATLYAISKAKLPIHVIGLVPASDNRPDGNAYVPDDIIRMQNKTSVEVVNTDAEGRLLLADALIYAQKYSPELVIDLATLTGSASNTVSNQAIVAMGNINNKEFESIKNSGFAVHERIIELPLWDEYNEMIKSEIADIKNVGGSEAGAITAGKFLEHFVDYPWIHLDIAGVAFNEKIDKYRPQGGTGFGVRLLLDFLSKKIK
ncbi:MAG: leucyl aminopeptidase, partial [Bacteroidota bacterium]|nr:leucyl aminopeptidase [Bacteroidota bacterium]